MKPRNVWKKKKCFFPPEHQIDVMIEIGTHLESVAEHDDNKEEKKEEIEAKPYFDREKEEKKIHLYP